MTSGIYKLTFSSGRFYIGKSNDIERRWKEHWTKFVKGTAAKNMQSEFLAYGEPRKEVLLECHEDHIDLMEAMHIELNKSPLMLNASYPTPPDIEDMAVFLAWGDQLLWYSTANHIRHIIKQETKISELNEQLEAHSEELTELETEYIENLNEIKDGTALQVAEDALFLVKEELSDVKRQLVYLKSRNWFERLFNF